jgi:hypothetical protein
MITELISGRYYVQVGAFSRAELVEGAINRIDSSYKPVVFREGNAIQPMYRILLGPLTLGESGAVLQRFKSIGYSDAFIRRVN